jgi:hypothetical protein
MILTLIRQEFTDVSTTGSLYINDVFFCYTLEDKDRGLDQSQSLLTINAKKLFGITAIPYGTYKVRLSMSNRFKRLLPEILNVKGYTGVRIHRGNTAEHSHGCPLVGFKKGVNSVFESTKAEEALMERLKGFQDITLRIIK